MIDISILDNVCKLDRKDGGGVLRSMVRQVWFGLLPWKIGWMIPLFGLDGRVMMFFGLDGFSSERRKGLSQVIHVLLS